MSLKASLRALPVCMVVCLFGSATNGQVLPSKGVEGRSLPKQPWRQMIDALRAGRVQGDEFATPLSETLKVEGTRIVERRPLRTESAKNYTYDNGVLTLYAAAILQLSDSFGGRPTMVISSSLHSGPEFVGSNAFGVSKSVTTSRRQDDGVIVLSAPPAHPPSPNGSIEIYQHSLTISGDTARLLVANVDVEIIGTVGEGSGLKSNCEISNHRATINDPHSLTIDSCNIPATLHSIALIDRRDGTVLRIWGKRDP